MEPLPKPVAGTDPLTGLPITVDPVTGKAVGPVVPGMTDGADAETPNVKATVDTLLEGVVEEEEKPKKKKFPRAAEGYVDLPTVLEAMKQIMPAPAPVQPVTDLVGPLGLTPSEEATIAQLEAEIRVGGGSLDVQVTESGLFDVSIRDIRTMSESVMSPPSEPPNVIINTPPAAPVAPPQITVNAPNAPVKRVRKTIVYGEVDGRMRPTGVVEDVVEEGP
jgi:hypothetical protein